MLIWITLATALLILVVLALRFLGDRPISYRGLLLVDTKRFLESFLLQMGVGSVFVLEREPGPGFLQLALTDRHSEVEELEFGLPDAGWCRERFVLVHTALETAEHNCRLEVDRDNIAVPRFLRVRIKGNREELTPRLIQVLTLAAGQLGFDSEDRYTLRMKGSISSEYQRGLADQMEQMPRGGLIARTLAAWLRRSAKTDQEE